MRRSIYYALSFVITLLIVSCSSTRYVPNGSYLLDDVKIQTNNKAIKPSDLSLYVRQTPNSKWFNLLKTQLYIYNWSGKDSTKWINRVLRRIGDPPVIYSITETERTKQELTKAVQNFGYMSAAVDVKTTTDKQKIKIVYDINTGEPYKIKSLKYDIHDSLINYYLKKDSTSSYLYEGMTFNVNTLDSERQRIVNYLLKNGYYKFNKEYITYTADTIRNTKLVDLTLHIGKYRPHNSEEYQNHRQYTINTINFITDYNVLNSSALSSVEVNDSIHYNGYPIYFKDKLYLRPKVLLSNTVLTPNKLYNEDDIQRTYSNFGRLQALKYTNIRFFETEQNDSAKLNAYIMLTKSKHNSVSFELEGTNSAGDLGAAASVSFLNRNLFKGSESFMLKLRGAYEAISGLQTSSHNNENYTEWGAEANLDFPRFMFPFLSTDFKKKIRATTNFGIQYNYQMRPEFTRIVASANWSYRWGIQQQHSQHRVDLIDFNYLYMPWIDSDFEDKYLNNKNNYILKYNYDNRFIVKMGYSYTYNSARQALTNNSILGNSYSFRFNFESAGNLLYLIAKAANLQKNSNGEYTLLNIPFAQYFKMDVDLAKNIVIDNRNSLAMHFAAGIVVPYGNATIVPFEKRYFAGGANSVRGWSVRSLGPGSFIGDGNFLNQTGDIKLDLSIEYRTRLFWKLRGAAFIDAGNIWTLRDYKDQPGGKFEFDKFYKQIAVSYGIGIRLDLDFFILRFDGGMKAINPAGIDKKGRFPIINPRFGRDFAFHFAVGYPF